MSLATYRSPADQSRWVINLLWVNLVLSTLILADDLAIWGPFGQTFASRPGWSTVVLGLTILWIVVWLITGVIWLYWARTCYRNLASFGLSSRWRAAWIFWGWLIPVGNFFIPFQLTNDLSVPADPTRTRPERVVGFGWWWGLYIIARTGSRGYASSITTDLELTPLPAFLDIADIVLAVLAILVVQQITQRHDTRFAAAQMAAAQAQALDGSESGLDELVLAPHTEPPTDDAETTPTAKLTRQAAVVSIAVLVIGLAISLGAGYERVAGGATVDASDLAPGQCYIGGTTGSILNVVTVDCTAPHDGQAVGSFVLPDESFPGQDEIFEYSVQKCQASYETSTGLSSYDALAELVLYHPSSLTWGSGDRTVVCVILSPDGTRSVRDRYNPAARTPWPDLEADGCYSFDMDFVTYESVDCAIADLSVADVIVLDLDVGAEFPGAETIRSRSIEACGSLDISLYPNERNWTRGDRQIVCLEPRPGF